MKRTLSILLVLASTIVSFVDARLSTVPLPVAFFKPKSAASSDPVLSITNGLLARWESTSITGVADGDSASPWPDASSYNRNAVVGFAPVFKTNIFGSKPAVRFDGSDDKLAFTNTAVTNVTVFVAWQLKEVSGFWTFGPINWRGTSGAGFTFSSDTTDIANPSKRMMVWDGAGTLVCNQAGPNESLNMPTTPRVKAIDTWRWNGTTCTMRKNGAAQTVTGATYTFGTPSDVPNIGYPYNACSADIAAILVYDNALSDADVVTVETYLNTKYPCF